MAKKILFCILMLIGCNTYAAQSCFILADLNTHKILRQQGNICNIRISPCSTFKIALSLMGYDSGILKNENSPVWDYHPEYPAPFPAWQSAHNPTTWIRDSCVWYSQVLTQKLGLAEFKKYVKLFDYGNQNLTGDSGKQNGLTNAWLSSSLKISPYEQFLFLQKLLNHEFPLTSHSYAMTKQILFVEKLSNGWNLYGKTGSGWQIKSDGSPDNNQHIGWFIGWITYNNRTLIFVKRVIDKDTDGTKVKAQVKKEILLSITSRRKSKLKP